jgi:phosphotriesterase-related protein
MTLLHEHILIDITNWLVVSNDPRGRELLDAPLSIEILGEIRHRPFSNRDNLVLSDERLAVEELTRYGKAGGRTIVDVTVPGIGRDPLALRRISIDTGLNLVTATGWYVGSAHPSLVRRKSSAELAGIIVKELTEGIGDTGIRAGVIGEIGCSVPYQQDEEKVLRAASRAQTETGAGINIHPGLFDLENKRIGKDAMRQLDTVEEEGGDLSKLYLDHCDYTCSDLDYQRRLLERGICLSYDNWGIEIYVDDFWPGAGVPSDRQKVDAVVELCKEGYDKQLVFSQDVCMKFLLSRYGGQGYGHVLRNIVPELKFRGVSRKQLRNILVENPKRILAF